MRSGRTGCVIDLVAADSFMDDLWCKNRQDLGKRGEDLALEYLLQRGMVLLARNWRSGHKELDLVMDDGECIRFVEVRAKNYPVTVEPYQTITLPKQRLVMAAARRFLAAARMGQVKGLAGLPADREAVFDIVSIIFNGELFNIKYIREAFGPQW